MKRVLILLLMMLLCIAPAYAAEDVFTVNAQDMSEDAWDESFIASDLTSDRSYLRVLCDVEGESPVTLSIATEDGQPVYQRDYGVYDGFFRSEDIYLRLSGSQTTYHVTLWVGDIGYSFPIRRVMPRLIGNTACSAGYPLTKLSGADSWKTATILDIAALEREPRTVALHASGAYEIGTATFTLEDGCLTVSAQLDEAVDGRIDKAKVYLAATALEAEQLGKKKFPGLTAKLDEAIDLQGTPYAAVYVNLTVSFNPAGAGEVPEDPALEGQKELWETMQQVTANEAVG